MSERKSSGILLGAALLVGTLVGMFITPARAIGGGGDLGSISTTLERMLGVQKEIARNVADSKTECECKCSK